MADREGFEPPIPLRVCRISSAVHSTSLPPVRGRCCRSGLVTTQGSGPRQPSLASFSQPCVEPPRYRGSSRAYAALLLDLRGRSDYRPPVRRGETRARSLFACRLRGSRTGTGRATKPATTAKKLSHAPLSSERHDGTGLNMENNDVRSHQNRRQAVPRRRER